MHTTLIPTIDGVMPTSKTQLRKAIQHRPQAVSVDILRESGWDAVLLAEMPPGVHTLEVLSPPLVLVVEVTEDGQFRVRV